MSETEKTNSKSNGRNDSTLFSQLLKAFCGTPEYIAPELLESQGYTKTYQRILTDPLSFPLDISSEAKSVMTGLLQRDPAKRLGANGGEEIKKHPFFSKYIDWNWYVFCLAYWRQL